jgi:rhodanese-related sulfurtransferase
VVAGGIYLAAPDSTSDNKTVQKSEAAPELTFKDVQESITKSGGQLLDVRTAEEYEAGHIEGAINLSLQDIQAGKLPDLSKDKTVYVYCRSGNRSKQAMTALTAAGYTQVKDLGAITHVQSIGGTLASK